MSDRISMATTFQEMVDCRMVQLELEFHQVTRNQLMELAQLCANESSRLFSEKCYCQWKYNGRRKSFSALLKRIESSNASFDFDFEADVLSDVVYDQNSFRRYDKQIQLGCDRWRDTDVSRDYYEYFREWVAGVQNSGEYQEAILRILNEPERKKEALWREHDISGLFTSCPYGSDKAMFRGQFRLCIALPCLQKDVSGFTETLIEPIRKAGTISQNVSGRIALSPISFPAPCSAHMLYFGGAIRNERSHAEMGLFESEWYPYSYFCGAEWYNYLSPLQVSHLCQPAKNGGDHNSFITTVYPNGAMSVKLKKGIDQVDVEDLRPVRKLLYDALYPGHSQILLKNLLDIEAYGCFAKIRQEWECIPIFPEEIIVDTERILFQHQLYG